MRWLYSFFSKYVILPIVFVIFFFARKTFIGGAAPAVLQEPICIKLSKGG